MIRFWTKRAGDAIFAIRWVLFPINLALIVALSLYVITCLLSINLHGIWNP